MKNTYEEIRLSDRLQDYIIDICSELYKMGYIDIMMLFDGLMIRRCLNGEQLDVVKGLAENARLAYEYCLDEKYDKIADELDRVIVGIDVGWYPCDINFRKIGMD